MMRRFAMLLVLPVVAALLLAAPVRADEVDRTDAAATAQAFLTAYRARDVVAMAPLSNSTNRDMFTELAEQGEEHKAYGDVFGGWRWDAAQAASGAVGQVRYSTEGDALVEFHRLDGEVAVIVLTREDGRWGVEDINSPGIERFEAMSTTPPE